MDNKRYVDLSERVTATYYDCEYEEWSEKTVTVEEVLDTTCDDYTVVEMPSAEPERKKGKWTIEDCHAVTYRYCCSVCKAHHRARYAYCPSCGADMRGDQNE